MKGNWVDLGFAGVLVLLGLQLGACETTHTADNSNTSWLERCDSNAACADGLSCLCGRCTRACDGDGACGGDLPGASCEPISGAALAASCMGQAPAAESICAARCSDDAACEAIRGDLACRSGVCVVPPQGDASVPAPAGRGGGPDPDPDAGGPRDAGTDAGDLCPDGMIVDAEDGCLQDDSSCAMLPDGRLCVGPAKPTCPAGGVPISPDEPCPSNAICWQYSESLRCRRSQALSMVECHALQGAALSAAQYPDLLRDGCPAGRVFLGMITDWNVGGLCCALRLADCAPQDADMIGTCEPAARFRWTGKSCVGESGCSCEGEDCDATFANDTLCLAEYMACTTMTMPCGGDTSFVCDADQYCAYVPGPARCGQADETSVCMPRPEACDDVEDPVCGCDGQTYSNACYANMAGTGVLARGPCD